jgi:hypothetical protein
MSTIKVDTLVAADGSSAVTLTKQQAAKVWLLYVQDTNTLESSFGVSSISDDSAGRFTTTVTNAFTGSTDYTYVGMSQSGSGSAYNTTIQRDGTPTTTTCAHEVVFNNATFSDLANGVAYLGDLA